MLKIHTHYLRARNKKEIINQIFSLLKIDLCHFSKKTNNED